MSIPLLTVIIITSFLSLPTAAIETISELDEAVSDLVEEYYNNLTQYDQNLMLSYYNNNSTQLDELTNNLKALNESQNNKLKTIIEQLGAEEATWLFTVRLEMSQTHIGKGMNIIETMNPTSFNDYLKRTQNTICGRHPICIMLQAAEHFRQMNNHRAELRFLRYSQSNLCRSMSDSSVSYAAGALVISPK